MATSEDRALPSLPDPSELNSSEFDAGSAVQTTAQSLLETKDYDGLEKAGQKYEEETSTFANGVSSLTFYFNGLADFATDATEDTYEKRESMLNDWIEVHPTSIFGKVAMAEFYGNYAWFARGSGYANTVTDSGAQGFTTRLQKARDILSAVNDQRSQCREWYEVMGQIGVGQGWSHDDFLAMINEGSRTFPNCIEIRGRAVMYLLPRWYGSESQVHDYITQSADAVGGDDGDVLYARLAKIDWSYVHEPTVFTETKLSWPRVKHGMELICNRYPHSTNMMNYFCLFAWEAGQRAVGNYLFEHLGSNMDINVWGSEGNFQYVKNWANGN